MHFPISHTWSKILAQATCYRSHAQSHCAAPGLCMGGAQDIFNEQIRILCKPFSLLDYWYPSLSAFSDAYLWSWYSWLLAVFFQQANWYSGAMPSPMNALRRNCMPPGLTTGSLGQENGCIWTRALCLVLSLNSLSLPCCQSSVSWSLSLPWPLP